MSECLPMDTFSLNITMQSFIIAVSVPVSHVHPKEPTYLVPIINCCGNRLAKFWFVEMNILVQNHNHLTTFRNIIFLVQGVYALLMTANKPKRALYSAPTFVFSFRHIVVLVHAI